MRSYEAARSLFSFLAFCAWCVIVLGAGVALLSSVAVGNSVSFGRNLSGLAVVTSLLPGFGISLLGLLGLALVQMGRATVDTAEYTQQMLQIARNQLEVSRQGFKRGSNQPPSFSEAGKDKEKQQPPPTVSFSKEADDVSASKGEEAQNTITYRGYEISKENGKFSIGGNRFAQISQAKQFADTLASSSIPTSKNKV